MLRIAWEQLYRELFDAVRDAGFADLREVHRPMVRYPPIDGLRPSLKQLIDFALEPQIGGTDKEPDGEQVYNRDNPQHGPEDDVAPFVAR